MYSHADGFHAKAADDKPQHVRWRFRAQQDTALATAGAVLSLLFVRLRGLSFRRVP